MEAALERPTAAESAFLPTTCRAIAHHSPQSYPLRVRRAPQLSKRCSTIAQQLPKRCSGSRNVAQFRPCLADVGQSWPTFGNNWPNLGQMSADFGQPFDPFGPHIGQLCWATYMAEVCRTSASSANFGPKFGQAQCTGWPKLRQRWHRLAEFGRTWSMFS